MFGRRRTDENPHTLIGAGSTIEGTVRVTHALVLEGAIIGEVDATGDVTVGPKGRLEGKLGAANATVAGTIKGTINVRGRLRVLADGHVKGEAHYDTLQVDPGGIVEGRTERVPSEGAPAGKALVQASKAAEARTEAAKGDAGKKQSASRAESRQGGGDSEQSDSKRGSGTTSSPPPLPDKAAGNGKAADNGEAVDGDGRDREDDAATSSGDRAGAADAGERAADGATKGGEPGKTAKGDRKAKSAAAAKSS